MEYITIIKDDVDLKSTNRYLRLPHPRTGQPQLYLPYLNSEGAERIAEVVKLNGSNRRTWFKGDSSIDAGSILIHHEIDLLFLIIPILLSMIPTSGQLPPFQPFSDLISQATASSSFALAPPFTQSSSSSATPSSSKEGWNEDVGRLFKLKSVKRVMKLACERKAIPLQPPSPPSEGDTRPPKPEIYYRPSTSHMVRLLQIKVAHFAQPQIFGRFDHLIRALGRDGLSTLADDDELVKSARVRAACDHLSQWLPPRISSSLIESYDFTTLNAHLANMTAASIAASIPNIPSSHSNKPAAKRKAPPASRGVESLKKVNTSSMAKMTSFFKPKETIKK